jgi:23S rRNA (adenine1618-N6)-methyltransferase
MQSKTSPTALKQNLHPRSKHRGRYDFEALIYACPALAEFVKKNEYGDDSVDFANPSAVKMLNKALLKHFYHINYWDIPNNYLCPPIPGRADYIHYMADLLSDLNDGALPTGNKITCLDIGIGANCVYPLIGVQEYDWSFIGVDIDAVALSSVNKIIELNPALHGKVETRLQINKNNILSGIFKKDDRIDITICNPPFHASLAEAEAGTHRKITNLSGRKNNKTVLNFGGQYDELIYKGGEKNFAQLMIQESKLFANSCLYFSILISKQENLNSVYDELERLKAADVCTIQMSQGNKVSRFVAWTFLTPRQQEEWKNSRWK